MKIQTYDFRSFCRGEMVAPDERQIEKMIGHIKRKPHIYTCIVYSLAVCMMPGSAFAGSYDPFADQPGTGGYSLIILMQKGAFWLGMAVSIWGIVEAQLDFPGWRGRILKGALGYVGILLIPLVFMELQRSLQVDVWNQMQTQQMVGGR